MKSIPVPLLFPIILLALHSSVRLLRPNLRHDPFDWIGPISMALRVMFCPQFGTCSPLMIVIPYMFSLVSVLLIIVELYAVMLESMLLFT